ncbi:helix-turn-helix domain-containing protein [Salinilacustrithrix flava]|uniref:helix-turn-helix domain-containing protein n=1 Tax=Salinilacustrithrix flava TaxID=2957203 RepID=UPI003D7C2675
MGGPAPRPGAPDGSDAADDGEGGLAALGAFIRDQRREASLSMRKLAEAAGVSNPYLSQIERGLRKPSADILQQLARALSISAETLYVRAGILERERGDVDVIGEILRDPSISVDQREALIRVYRSFRAEAAAGAEPDEVDSTGQESSEGERR